MVSKGNAWWMSRTNGIYSFSLSPFRQRAFAGFGAEMKNMVKLHWKGSIVFVTMATGFYSLVQWANQSYKDRHRKDPAYYDKEFAMIEQQRQAREAELKRAEELAAQQVENSAPQIA